MAIVFSFLSMVSFGPVVPAEHLYCQLSSCPPATTDDEPRTVQAVLRRVRPGGKCVLMELKPTECPEYPAPAHLVLKAYKKVGLDVVPWYTNIWSPELDKFIVPLIETEPDETASVPEATLLTSMEVPAVKVEDAFQVTVPSEAVEKLFVTVSQPTSVKWISVLLTTSSRSKNVKPSLSSEFDAMIATSPADKVVCAWDVLIEKNSARESIVTLHKLGIFLMIEIE